LEPPRARRFAPGMRVLLPAALLLAACSGGDEAQNNAMPPAPQPTGPAPRTPVTQNVTPEPGETPAWLAPESNAGDPKEAPFDQSLDRPLVSDVGR
jgi:hypothetical protein